MIYVAPDGNVEKERTMSTVEIKRITTKTKVFTLTCENCTKTEENEDDLILERRAFTHATDTGHTTRLGSYVRIGPQDPNNTYRTLTKTATDFITQALLVKNRRILFSIEGTPMLEDLERGLGEMIKAGWHVDPKTMNLMAEEDAETKKGLSMYPGHEKVYQVIHYLNTETNPHSTGEP